MCDNISKLLLPTYNTYILSLNILPIKSVSFYKTCNFPLSIVVDKNLTITLSVCQPVGRKTEFCQLFYNIIELSSLHKNNILYDKKGSKMALRMAQSKVSLFFYFNFNFIEILVRFTILLHTKFCSAQWEVTFFVKGKLNRKNIK